MKRTGAAVSATQGARFSRRQRSVRTLLGWRSSVWSLIRVREKGQVIQHYTTQEDSRKWDSHGSVSSGCPGRHSHSCRRPGEQNPGCPRDPGLSGRPPCSSGSGYTAPPGSVPKQEHISNRTRKQGITTELSNMIKLYYTLYDTIQCFLLQSLQILYYFWPSSQSFCQGQAYMAHPFPMHPVFLKSYLFLLRLSPLKNTCTRMLTIMDNLEYISSSGWLISCLFVPISVTSSQSP